MATSSSVRLAEARLRMLGFDAAAFLGTSNVSSSSLSLWLACRAVAVERRLVDATGLEPVTPSV